jgi:hypothetical protein
MLESGYATAFDVIYPDDAALATQITFHDPLRPTPLNV